MLLDLYTKYSILRNERADIENIKHKLVDAGSPALSPAQEKDIRSYWLQLTGENIPIYWHSYFTARNGNFSVRYVPTSLYHKSVIYRLNNYKFRHAYVDKGVYDTFFPDVNRPKTIVKSINGYYYDDHGPIRAEDALRICDTLDGAVIKPTLEGMWGEGVRVFESQNGILNDGDSVEALIRKYGTNFIIQEKVRQHSGMSRLNPTSLNTLRVLSYRDGNEVFILYAVVRIGRKDKVVDNETAGGINADVDLVSGRIKDCAYGTPKEKKIYKTDSGTELKGYQIPSFHAALETVKSLHLRLPYFNLIGWDFGIDEDGRPVMIEWNRAPDLSQTAHGPAFGDFTEDIFKRIKSLPDTRF